MIFALEEIYMIDIYRNPSYTSVERTKDLLNKMTVEGKLVRCVK